MEHPLELDLTQQDAVLGLPGRSAGGGQVPAAQGVEGGGVAQAISITQGRRGTAAVVVSGVRDRPEGGERDSQRRRKDRAA
jgi:hypothetical protein